MAANNNQSSTVKVVRIRLDSFQTPCLYSWVGNRKRRQGIPNLEDICFQRLDELTSFYSGEGRTSPVIPSWLPTGAVSSAQGRHPSKPFLLAGEKSMSRVPPKHLLFAALFLLPAIRN